MTDGAASPAPGVRVTATAAYEPPLDWTGLLGWLTVRALPGVERVTRTSCTTALLLPGGPGVVTARHDSAGHHIDVAMRLTSADDEAEALADVRRLLDLDARPHAIDSHLARVPVLAPLVAQGPGMRIPGEPTPLAALVRALAGQQVSVAGGLAQMYRLVEATHGPVTHGQDTLAPFPTAERILDAGFDWYRGPAARRGSIRAAVEFAAAGGLDSVRPTEQIAADLLALKGIGPWTVAYTLMRGYGDADVDLAGDRALVNAARALTREPLPALLDASRPYRSYAALYLWRSAGS